MSKTRMGAIVIGYLVGKHARLTSAPPSINPPASKGPTMSGKNLQVTLASRPTGWVEEANFKLVETAIPTPGEGEILLRVRHHNCGYDDGDEEG